MTMRLSLSAACLVLALAGQGLTRAADWPQYGGQDSRNMVSGEKNAPASFNPGLRRSDGFDPATARNVKWIAKLGSHTYSSPVVAGPRVFIGTNNASPRDAKYSGDRGVLMCFERATGKFLWQLVIPKIAKSGPVNMDHPLEGITSTPTVEGDRVFVVSNRGEALCLDVHGLANGNDGPYLDEARLFAVPAEMKLNPAIVVHRSQAHVPKPGTPIFMVKPGTPVALSPTDADVIWRCDMLAELSVWPQDATNSAILIRGDLLYLCTSNGVDMSHTNVPSPESPTLIALDKRTGKPAGLDDARMGPRILHGSWSSPSFGEVAGRGLVFLGGPDGVCCAFDPRPVGATPDTPGTLRKVWWHDCNPPAARFKDRASARYKTKDGPSEIVATPVFRDNRVYVAVGQDPNHVKGTGGLVCIDAAGAGDVTDKGTLWAYRKINRSLSTVAIADGLLYAADLAGTVHCLEADTGRVCWLHEALNPIWGSPLVADGKVYIGTTKGEFWILAAGREKKVLDCVKLATGVSSTPVFVDGVLYVPGMSHLFAIQSGGAAPRAK